MVPPNKFENRWVLQSNKRREAEILPKEIATFAEPICEETTAGSLSLFFPYPSDQL